MRVLAYVLSHNYMNFIFLSFFYGGSYQKSTCCQGKKLSLKILNEKLARNIFFSFLDRLRCFPD